MIKKKKNTTIKRVKKPAKKKNKAGRKSKLTVELSLEIRRMVLNGAKYIEIREKLNIPEGTWDGWITMGINDLDEKLSKWKRQRMLKASEKVLSDIVEMSPEVQAMGAFGPIFAKDENDKKTAIMKTDVGILKIKQDTAKFVTENLASDVFNKKIKVEHGVTDPLDQLLREISDA